MNKILTTHAGSLTRPADLAAALIFEPGGECPPYAGPGTFDERLSQGVRDIVRRQAETGLDIVDDGEMSKTGWVHYAYWRLKGIEPRYVKLDEEEFEALIPKNLTREGLGQQLGWFTPYQLKTNGQREGTEWVCTGPLEYDSTALTRDLANLKAGLAGVDVTDAFVPCLSPGSVWYCRNEYYNTEEDFIFAFAEAMRNEYRAIIDAGFMLQVDDPVIWNMYEVNQLRGGTEADYRRWIEPRLAATNHALEGLPQERIRTHLCSASALGPHMFDPPLKAVIDWVLKLNVGTYLIEFGNVRHEHEYHMWEEVTLPDDKILAPGVVTHHTGMIEHPELVAERILRFANLLGPERVIASTDCGFQQSAFWERVPEWTQWAKLQALVEGARIASQRLWGPRAEVA